VLIVYVFGSDGAKLVPQEQDNCDQNPNADAYSKKPSVSGKTDQQPDHYADGHKQASFSSK
jgi:hypothetical protein